ncbi:hypothetical protein FACS1894133_1420 [Clostridia bacterium]|nr:hypothetical protein FACS1894133_1420 [Clostridia bacterium]
MNIEITGRYFEHLPSFCFSKKAAVKRAASAYTDNAGNADECVSGIAYEAVFVGGIPLARYYGGCALSLYPALFVYSLLLGLDVQYCRSSEKEGLRFYLPPEHVCPVPANGDFPTRVWRRLARRRTRKVSREALDALNDSLVRENEDTARKIAAELKNQAMFMRKFNNSIFRAAYENGVRLSVSEWDSFFRSHTDRFDLSDERVRNAFISLYAITHLGMSARDMFAVDSVFAVPDRASDNIKQQAGVAVYELVKHGGNFGADNILRREMADVAASLRGGGSVDFREDYLIRAGVNEIERLFAARVIGG